MSQYQIGGKKGRSTADTVITTNNIIHRNRTIGRKTNPVIGDAEKIFDKLWLKDCIVELYWNEKTRQSDAISNERKCNNNRKNNNWLCQII